MKAKFNLLTLLLTLLPYLALGASTVDPTIPKAPYASTGACQTGYNYKDGYCRWSLDPAPIRNNFAAAYNDITALQNNSLTNATPITIGGDCSGVGVVTGINISCSPFLRGSNNLSDLASAGTARTNLGLGTAATQNVTAFLQPSNNLSDIGAASTARTNLGLGALAVKSVADLSTDTTGVLPVNKGGTGTATPGIVAGTNITVSGTWPNQTVSSSGGANPAGAAGDIQTNSGSGTLSAVTVKQFPANMLNQPRLPRWEAKKQSFGGLNSGRVRILVQSDSTGVSGVNPDVGWPYQLANAFQNAGIKASHGSSFGGIFPFDTQRVTINSSWTVDTTTTTVGGNTYKATTNTNALSFLSSWPIGYCRVWYIQQPSGGSFTVDVGGISPATVNTAGTLGLASYDWSSGGTTFANSTCNVKWSSGGQVNIAGFETWDGGGVSIINTSLGGSAVGGWSDQSTAISWLNGILAMAPDMVIMAPGVNSMPGTSLSTYQSQVHTMATALQAAGIDVVMLTPIPQNPADGSHNNSVATQDGYVNVNRSEASSLGLPLLDVYSYFGSYAISSIAPYSRYVDTWVHPNYNGTAAITDLVYTYLMGQRPGNVSDQHVDYHTINALNGYNIRGGLNLSRGGVGTVVVGVTTATGTSGTNNTVVGDGAAALLSAGQNNTVVGNGALAASQSGRLNNTAVGYQALKVATASDNTALGLQAGLLVTTGGDNTLLGHKAASTVLTTGARNIIIANGATATTTPAAATNDYINIGNALRGYTVAPTISSGFGTSPSIVAGNSTFLFAVNVGTGGTASSGVVAPGTAPNGWGCDVDDITNGATNSTRMTSSNTTTATFTNFSRTTGAVTPWTASDVLLIKCNAY